MQQSSSRSHRITRRISSAKALALIAAILTLPVVDATAHPQELGFGPRFGAYTAGDADGIAQSGGASVRLKMLPFLGIEGSLDYSQEAFGDGLVTARCWPVMITGILYPLPMIYGIYGVDWNHMTLEYADGRPSGGDESTMQVAWHAGGGLEIPLGEAASLVGEFRYVFLDYEFVGLPDLDGANTNSYFVTLGFLISLLPPESATPDTE